MLIISCIGVLGLLAAPAAAFWRLPCKAPLVVERADPIVNPGNVSGHVHQIMGGNGFDYEMTYADTQASTCTSCTVHGDFSNYWTPVLYYQHQDGTFEKVDQVGGGLVYYLQRSGPNKDKLQAFPEGFRMISGDPFKRSPGDDFASQAISYNCLDYDGPAKPETPGFPAYNCPNGLRSQVFFPSCWDGVNLDSPNHKSHVAFPIGAYNDGKCPDTHPVHLISIFYEVIWDTNKFKDMWHGTGQPFVWAQGDPTGYGFHGDFLMGWDRNILQRAVDECTNDSGRVEDCPVFDLYSDSVAQGCKKGSKIDEDVQGPFNKLPGCNAVTPGPESAPIVKTCDGNNATIGEGKPLFTDLTNQNWAYQGCGIDNYYSRALTGTSTSKVGMTNEQCVEFCDSKGYSIAGTEYSKECYCGNSIPTSAQPIPGVIGNCNMKCDGNSDEFCGGSGALSLYQKCTGTICQNADGVGSGSSTPVSSKLLSTSTKASASTASPASSSISISSVNQQTKAQSLTGSTSSASRFTNIQPTTRASLISLATHSTSSSPSSTITKSASPSSTSAINSSPTNVASGLASNWTYISCLADALNPRTLPNLAPYTLDNKLVTSTSCVSWCSSKGYSLAGTEYGGECWCGNSLPSNSQPLAESKCNVPCKGDGSQKCGGPAALSLYANKAANISIASHKARASWAKRDEAGNMVKLHDHVRRHALHAKL